jgi:hypothetical protein
VQTIHQARGERTPASVSEILLRDIDAFAADAQSTNSLFRLANTGALSPGTFGRYLRSIHYLLRHTPIHLDLAEECARRAGHALLAEYFARKRAEEEGHDRWAEDGIEGLARHFGVDVPDEPTPAMRAIIAANAAGIAEDPHYYLAYIMFAEYFVVVAGPGWVGALAEKCGISRALTSAIGNHIELDREHVAEGCSEIDAFIAPEHAERMRRAVDGMMKRLSAFGDELSQDAQ